MPWDGKVTVTATKLSDGGYSLTIGENGDVQIGTISKEEIAAARLTRQFESSVRLARRMFGGVI